MFRALPSMVPCPVLLYYECFDLNEIRHGTSRLVLKQYGDHVDLTESVNGMYRKEGFSNDFLLKRLIFRSCSILNSDMFPQFLVNKKIGPTNLVLMRKCCLFGRKAHRPLIEFPISFNVKFNQSQGLSHNIEISRKLMTYIQSIQSQQLQNKYIH